ncbi:MAG: DNA alkylation repair protein [Opitutaceae bacterium]|nr:DNA alkylation repair protein [Opitutaceae bacterium]
MPSAADVVDHLESLRNERNIAGMARFGIRPARPLGISIAILRPLAKKLGRDHALSEALWASGWHEARILAAFVEEPARVTRRLMDARAAAFDSWDICDQWCLSVFWRTPHAWTKARQWAGRRAEFVKRAGFSLLAVLAVHDHAAQERAFLEALALVEREASDERNYVKKAVNWALRQIGKRDPRLRRAAIATATRIAKQDSRAARWVAADALRELQRNDAI